VGERIYHLNVLPHRRALSVYATGSAMVRTVRTAASSAVDGAAHAQLDDENARDLVDALAAATGHYPQSLDAQRARIAGLTADLVAAADGDDEPAQLAELALTRHIGEMVATAADLVYRCRAYMADHDVAELAAELLGMVDAMRVGQDLTNPEARIAAHYRRIQELRQQLPTPGAPTPA